MFSPAHLAGLNCFQCWSSGTSVAACGKDEDGDPACEKHMAAQPVAEPISSSENQQGKEKPMNPAKNLDREHIQLLRNEGKNTKEIAQILGVAVSTVYKYEGKGPKPKRTTPKRRKPSVSDEIERQWSHLTPLTGEPRIQLTVNLTRSQIEKLLEVLAE